MLASNGSSKEHMLLFYVETRHVNEEDRAEHTKATVSLIDDKKLANRCEANSARLSTKSTRLVNNERAENTDGGLILTA